jgi:hypothetical protein
MGGLLEEPEGKSTNAINEVDFKVECEVARSFRRERLIRVEALWTTSYEVLAWANKNWETPRSKDLSGWPPQGLCLRHSHL